MDTTESSDAKEQEMDSEKQEKDQTSSENNQTAQNGMVLEEKESLQARLEELQTLYEKTRHELEAAREALSKFETAQDVTTASGVETEDSLQSESVTQESPQLEFEGKQDTANSSARGNTFKIFVGNLSDYATRTDLRELFEAYGTVVEADVVKNYGFVHMVNEDEGLAAVEALNGQMLRGKPMVVQTSSRAKKEAVISNKDSRNEEGSTKVHERGDTFKIFVGNLSDYATGADIRELFEAHGKVVEADVVKNYGFVHMEKEEEGQAAIEALNGHMLRGKPMVVEASTRAKKSSNQTTKIFVGNVHRESKRQELKSLFEAFGNVVEADILTNYAFVHMDDEVKAEQAIHELDGHELHGMRLIVRKSISRGRHQAGTGNRDMCIRCGPGERGSRPFGSRYDPYPPPPPPRYVRDHMMHYKLPPTGPSALLSI
ncbi:uncharacterized protein [Panulirus ornatus]|uniref:uncharacterized protein isoform X2 n=1 Tax=Panulirus ornatus TaxID=150431 RepID=UPI003A8420CD